MVKHFCDWCHKEIVRPENSMIRVETGKGNAHTLCYPPREFCSTQCALDALKNDAVELKHSNLYGEYMNMRGAGGQTNYADFVATHAPDFQYTPRVEPPFEFRDYLD